MGSWLARLEQSLARVPITAVAFALAAAVVVVGIQTATKIGGGADAYGYVSQADLWLNGKLTVPQPWVKDVPWPAPAWTFTPLGYRPRGVMRDGEIVEDPTTLVPTYSPGLPMIMALAKSIGGHCQMFAVVPVFGGLLVLATFGLGRRLGSPATGLLAAWLIATSPTFLFMLVQPMSDVPVAAAWAIALWCLLGSGVGSALGAGLAASLTILIRPNLAPMVAVAVPWLAVIAWRAADAERRHAIYRTLAYVAGMLPAVAAVAWLNNYWYGAPSRSGYGRLEALYDWINVVPNMRLYFGWLVETQTVVALLGLLVLVLPRVWPASRIGRGWIIALFGASTAVLWVQYFFYGQFEAWWYLRFLLASWPAIFLAAAMVMTWPARAGRRGWALAVLVVAAVLGARGVVMASDRYAFDLRVGEQKYTKVADIVRRRTETRAVILSMQHSGSLRYYGARMTLRYDWIDGEWFDHVIKWLNDHGSHPYLVIDDWELPDFQRRFARRSVVGALERAPVRLPHGVLMFDLAPEMPGAPATPETVADPVLPDCVSPRPVPPLVFKY